jgi:ketosteroid isomerase-like protein
MAVATSLTEQNRAVIQALYDAGARGDVPELLSYLADDIVVHEPEYLPYGGRYVGQEAFLAIFAQINEHLDLSAITLDHLVADNEHVIGVLRIPDRATGQNTVLAEQSTLRDGKVIDMQVFYFDPQSMIDKPEDRTSTDAGG